MGMTLIWVLLSLIAVSVAIAILPTVLWVLGIFFIIILIVYILWFVINFIVWIAPVVLALAIFAIIWGIINKITGRPTGFRVSNVRLGNIFKRKSKRNKSGMSSSQYEAEKNEILDDLNNGRISVEEAMKKLNDLKKKYM
jgi:hypothetical protein